MVAVSPEKGQLLQNARLKAMAVRQGVTANGDNKTALLSAAYKVKRFNTMQLKIIFFPFQIKHRKKMLFLIAVAVIIGIILTVIIVTQLKR